MEVFTKGEDREGKHPSWIKVGSPVCEAERKYYPGIFIF